MNYLFLITAKIVDNLLATSKTILIQKGRGILAAISVVVSQIIFFTIISEVVTSKDNFTMILVSISGGIGTYIAIMLNDRFSEEQVFINSISSDDKEAMTELCEYLRKHKIKNLVTDSYTKDWGRTLSVTVFAETKESSRLVDKFINESDRKYLRIVR